MQPKLLENPNSTVGIQMLKYHAPDVIRGVLKGVSQIFLQADVACGVLILVGIFISSPISAIACLFGSLLSTL